MAQTLGTQATLRIHVSILTPPWSLQQIKDALTKFAMKGHSVRTMAHSIFESEDVSRAHINYEKMEIMVPMSVTNIQSLFTQVKSQHDLIMLFTRDFVSFMTANQLLRADSAQLSAQALGMQAAKKIQVEIE